MMITVHFALYIPHYAPHLPRPPLPQTVHPLWRVQHIISTLSINCNVVLYVPLGDDVLGIFMPASNGNRRRFILNTHTTSSTIAADRIIISELSAASSSSSFSTETTGATIYFNKKLRV